VKFYNTNGWMWSPDKRLDRVTFWNTDSLMWSRFEQLDRVTLYYENDSMWSPHKRFNGSHHVLMWWLAEMLNSGRADMTLLRVAFCNRFAKSVQMNGVKLRGNSLACDQKDGSENSKCVHRLYRSACTPL
jgi:hypothetical protein